ncbi:MAG: preprotein translocase subunit YajC [Acidimicrobiales bacterium]
MQYLFLIILLAAMYFLILRPRAKAQQASRKAGLAAGDDVMSNSGIFGVVTKAYDQRVWVEIAPEVEVIFDRRTLTRIDPAIVDAMEAAEAKMDAVAAGVPLVEDEETPAEDSSDGVSQVADEFPTSTLPETSASAPESEVADGSEVRPRSTDEPGPSAE